MADYTDEIAELIRQGRKIEAIKLLRESTGIGLKDAKDYVEQLMAGTVPEIVHEPTLESDGLPPDVLFLLRSGEKIEAIKLLRERTGLSLKEAKERVDRELADPSVVTGPPKRRVRKMVFLWLALFLLGMIAVRIFSSG